MRTPTRRLSHLLTMPFLAAALWLTPGAAHAQQTPSAQPPPAEQQPPRREPYGAGIYFGVHGGANGTHSASIDEFRLFSAFIPDGEAEFDIDFAAGGVIGYKTGGTWRAELEVTHRENAFNEIEWSATGKAGTFKTAGSVNSLAIMFNSIWDLRTSSKLRPSLGFGVGIAQVELVDVTDSDGLLFDDEEVNFAFQAIAGLSFAITERVTASMNYKYFVSSITTNIDAGQPASIADDRVTIIYTNSAFMLGLSYRF